MSILSLASALPDFEFTQEEVAEKICALFNPSDPERVKSLYSNSAINKRYSAIPDFKYERGNWHFWGNDYPKTVPGMTQRNEYYKKTAPQLSHKAAEQAIHRWGGDRQEITHIIYVSCTGLVAPGVEFLLMQSLGLQCSVHRLGINFMGCFGAFKGLSVAKALAEQDANHVILLVCTELCSLHFQAELDIETLTANALFGDGSAAAIVGQAKKRLWKIGACKSFALEKSLEKMSWEASDRGFLMKLSHQVPVLLGRHLKQFTASLLHEKSDENLIWAIHPGGKSILQAVEKALQLKTEQTCFSWNILAEYGNMSSATFLFVLERIASKQIEDAIGIGFGPGLSMEGIVLTK